MKTPGSFVLALLAVSAFAASSQAAFVVNDFFSDGTRTDPAAPVYSENGVDVDLDGNIESALFTNNAANVVTTPGQVTTTLPTGSSSYYTYFTPSAPITLNVGDAIRFTLAFIPQGVTTTTNSTNFRVGFYNSGGTRTAADGNITGMNYRGYSFFSNFATTLNANPLTFNRRSGFANADPLNSSADQSTISTSRGPTTAGTAGFASGMSYLLTLTATRVDTTTIQINGSFTGGTIGDTGNISGIGVDTTATTTLDPASFGFDTFDIRPTSSAGVATSLSFTNFAVEYLPVPEPSTYAILMMAGAMGIVGVTRQRRRAV